MARRTMTLADCWCCGREYEVLAEGAENQQGGEVILGAADTLLLATPQNYTVVDLCCACRERIEVAAREAFERIRAESRQEVLAPHEGFEKGKEGGDRDDGRT